MNTRGIKPATLTDIAHSLGYKQEADAVIQPGSPRSIALQTKVVNRQAWYEFWH
jgi:hypothetical protein